MQKTCNNKDVIKLEKSWLTGAGAVASALLAHVPCCGLNLALILGAAGSGSSFLSGLSPYRPWFIGFSLIMSGLTLWLAFKPHKAHACGDCCQESSHKRRSSFKKLGALALAAVSVAGVFLAPAGHIHAHGQSESAGPVAHH